MATRRGPAFQFYCSKYLQETAGFPAIARGVEIVLRAQEWAAGPLPGDLASLARIAGVTRAEMGSIWRLIGKRFRKVRSSFVSKHNQTERRKQAIFRALQRKKGKAGAAKRWHSRGHRPAVAEAWPADSPPEDQDHKSKDPNRRSPAGRPGRSHDDRFRLLARATPAILLRVCHDVLDAVAAGRLLSADLNEVRARCGELRIDYSALEPDAIRRALEKAEHARQRRATQ